MKLYILKSLLTFLLLNNAIFSQSYEIKFDINSGKAWFGGDNRPGLQRNVAQAQSVFIEQPIKLESFAFYFDAPFDSALNGTGSGHEVTLRLHFRDSLGNILVNKPLVIPDTFSVGWIKWTEINYDITEPATYIFSSFLVGGYDSNQVKSSIVYDSNGGYLFGTRYSKEVFDNNDARSWINWGIHSTSDLNFWLTGTLLPTNIENEKSIPIKFVLEQNYPNPFNPTTKIRWQSPVNGWQSLKIYDVLGNIVTTLVDEYRNAGRYEVEFSAIEFSSGIYFYQLHAGEFTETKKLILMK
jgi:hypothetical protein